MTTNKTGLALKENENPSGNLVGLTKLLTQLKTQPTASLSKANIRFLGKALEGRMLEKGRGR